MLYHLLVAEHPEDIVALEEHDDVSIIKKNGHWYIEQATSSQDKNPLTNKSSKPWKTISNWVRGIENNIYPAENTDFVLYVLQDRKPQSLIKLLHDANTEKEAEIALKKCKKFFQKEDVTSDLKEHLDIIFDDKYRDTVKKIIARFKIVVGNSDPDFEIKCVIANQPYSENRAKQFLIFTQGWVDQITNALLASKQKAIIKRQQFLSSQAHFNERYCSSTRMEFVLGEHEQPSKDALIAQVKLSPTYIKQLKIIELDQGMLLRAAGDYLKACVYRTKMSQSSEYTATVFTEYEEELKITWSNQKLLCDIPALSDVAFGQKLYASCNDKNKDFLDKTTPDFFTRGNYHYLANAPLENLEIGWHRDFKSRLKKFVDEGESE